MIALPPLPRSTGERLFWVVVAVACVTPIAAELLQAWGARSKPRRPRRGHHFKSSPARPSAAAARLRRGGSPDPTATVDGSSPRLSLRSSLVDGCSQRRLPDSPPSPGRMRDGGWPGRPGTPTGPPPI